MATTSGNFFKRTLIAKRGMFSVQRVFCCLISSVTLTISAAMPTNVPFSGSAAVWLGSNAIHRNSSCCRNNFFSWSSNLRFCVSLAKLVLEFPCFLLTILYGFPYKSSHYIYGEPKLRYVVTLGWFTCCLFCVAFRRLLWCSRGLLVVPVRFYDLGAPKVAGWYWFPRLGQLTDPLAVLHALSKVYCRPSVVSRMPLCVISLLKASFSAFVLRSLHRTLGGASERSMSVVIINPMQ